MAGSSSFTKRQKERARQERQLEKARKKAEKKLQKDEPAPPAAPGIRSSPTTTTVSRRAWASMISSSRRNAR